MTEINDRIAKVREQIIDTKIIREKLGLKEFDEIIDDFEVFITTIESQASEIADWKQKEFQACSKHHEFIAEIEQLEEERDQALKDYESACAMSSDNSRAAIKLSDEVESLKAITELKNAEIERLRMIIKAYSPFELEDPKNV